MVSDWPFITVQTATSKPGAMMHVTSSPISPMMASKSSARATMQAIASPVRTLETACRARSAMLEMITTALAITYWTTTPPSPHSISATPTPWISKSSQEASLTIVASPPVMMRVTAFEEGVFFWEKQENVAFESAFVNLSLKTKGDLDKSPRAVSDLATDARSGLKKLCKKINDLFKK